MLQLGDPFPILLSVYNTMIHKKLKYVQQANHFNSIDLSSSAIPQPQNQHLPLFSTRKLPHPQKHISFIPRSIDVAPLKTIQYTLPPLSTNKEHLQHRKSFTISPKQLQLSPKKSNPKFNKYFNTVIMKRKPQSLNLKGKKFDPVPLTSMKNKWIIEDNNNNNSTLASQTVLFNKKKQDVMKSVLLQIQPKFK